MEQMNKISIHADGYKLTPDWAVVGTSGSYGVSTLAFEFDAAWDGLVRRITFFPADGADAIEMLMTGDEIVVPSEAMAEAGTAEYVVDGTRDGARLISLCGRLRILHTKDPGGEAAAEPTEDAYAQLLAMIKEGGIIGKSAYEIAVEQGFEGSEAEWLASLNGSDYILTDADKAEIAAAVLADFTDASEVAL